MLELTGGNSAELRERYLAKTFIPLARHAFATDPDVQSLTLAVAQFWADEALDAVHIELVPSTDPLPIWPQVVTNSPYYDNDEGFVDLNERGQKLLPWDQLQKVPRLDENSTAITAFASYCAEMTSQEDTLAEAFVPYAVAIRSDDDVAVEVIGKMHRPEWEDADWPKRAAIMQSYGMPAELIQIEHEATQEFFNTSQGPVSRPKKFKGFFRRLFGR